MAMDGINPIFNPVLFELAQRRIWSDLSPHKEKQAQDPGMAPPGGAAPMGGGPAPAPPAAAPGGPAMSPPPMDPSMMGGAPGMMPGAAPGMAPGGMPGMAPAQPQKVKPEQMMQMLDFRMYNMQQQMTAIMNALGIQLPPGALVLPPGATMAPPAEAALPGGPQDPTAQGQQGGGQSAIQPVEPIQGASPEAAQAQAQGGGGKQASLVNPEGRPYASNGASSIPTAFSNGRIEHNVAAVAALMRSKAVRGTHR